MTAAEVLDRAITEKKNRPHVQGNFTGRYGGICMMAALGMGSGLEYSAIDNRQFLDGSPEVTPAMKAAITAMGFKHAGELCSFNNTHSKEACIEKMDEGLRKLTQPIGAHLVDEFVHDLRVLARS